MTFYRRFLAYFRLDLAMVCELSKGRGEYNDYHDHPDSTLGWPAHFYRHTCKRCGKRFCI